MNRNAAEIIRHLETRIARLEGRTASGDDAVTIAKYLERYKKAKEVRFALLQEMEELLLEIDAAWQAKVAADPEKARDYKEHMEELIYKGNTTEAFIKAETSTLRLFHLTRYALDALERP